MCYKTYILPHYKKRDTLLRSDMLPVTPCLSHANNESQHTICPTNNTKVVRIIGLLPHHSGLLPEPIRVPLVLTVHFHFLWSKWRAAVTVEVQAVVATDVRPLLLLLSILWLQKLREAGLWALRSEETTILYFIILRVLIKKNMCGVKGINNIYNVTNDFITSIHRTPNTKFWENNCIPNTDNRITMIYEGSCDTETLVANSCLTFSLSRNKIIIYKK